MQSPKVQRIMTVIAVSLLWFFWRPTLMAADGSRLPESIQNGLNLLETHPFLLWLSIAILPAVGFPASPLLILAGIVFAQPHGMFLAFLMALSALTVNMAFTYWLAAVPAHSLLSRWLGRTRWKLPAVSQENHVKLTILFRVTPGIPFVVQNYVLGLARIEFKTYLGFSVLFQSFYTCGFVVFAGALFQGKAGGVILGVALLIAAIVFTKILRSHFAKRKARDSSAPSSPVE